MPTPSGTYKATAKLTDPSNRIYMPTTENDYSGFYRKTSSFSVSNTLGGLTTSSLGVVP